MGKIAFLETSCWAGVSFDAEHYYGKIYVLGEGNHLQSHELTRVMTESDAAKLNKKDHWLHAGWKSGDTTTRFDTEEAVIDAGKRMFIDLVEDGVLLIGSSCSADPQPVIATSGDYAEFEAQAKVILEEHDRLHWGRDDAKMYPLLDRWDKLLEQYNLSVYEADGEGAS